MIKRKKQKVRVRIAPSPTGFFHFGTARTALYNYLFAKQSRPAGQFILRIEDTDKERSKKEYADDIVNNLKFLGLSCDEGPYYQSQRDYKEQIEKLLKSGHAFYCNHTREELDKEKKAQMKKGEGPRHVCSRYGKKMSRGIIRFHSPRKKIIFHDLIRGQVEFDAGLLGDFSIAKDAETALYNLAAVVDDYEMKISHVIRGEDHISNTPKQILIYEALGLPLPEFAHLPMILGPDRSKMSKRHGHVSLSWYRQQGFLSEALVNFMALLGWNPGTEQEIFSLPELVKAFSLKRVHKGGAVFDMKRLEWLNAHYIRQLDTKELAEKCLPYLKKAGLAKKADMSYIQQAVALEQTRMKYLGEIGELTRFFFVDELDYPKELLRWKDMNDQKVKENLNLLKEAIEKAKKFDQVSLENLITPLTKKHGTGDLLWPLRVALTGRKGSPGPFEIMAVLGKEKTLARIEEGMRKAE